MAKGFDENKQRNNDLNLFAKDLVRRSKSKCEICEVKDVSLNIFEVPPVDEQANIDKCVLICDECRKQILKPALIDPNKFRCLNNSIWSDFPAVKVLSAVLLYKLKDNNSWAFDLLDQACLDDDIDQWILQASEEL